MGNRAVVIFANQDETSISPAVYLHWYGGPEAIYPFLDEMDRRHLRADQDYEAARFIQLVGEFMDQDTRSSLSLGVWNSPPAISIEELKKLEQGDNGVYVVCRNGKGRKVRRFACYPFRELDEMAVARELKEAMSHEYNSGAETIASYFAADPRPIDEAS